MPFSDGCAGKIADLFTEPRRKGPARRAIDAMHLESAAFMGHMTAKSLTIRRVIASRVFLSRLMTASGLPSSANNTDAHDTRVF
jgi:hypothetical protein